MMTNSERKIPEFRFEGFTDDWEQREWGSLVQRLTEQSNNHKLPRVEYEDINSSEGTLNKDISNKFDRRKGTLFTKENILFGKLRPYLKNWLLADFSGIALGDFWVFDTKENDSKFIYYLMQTERYQTVANLSAGTKMPRSDWNTVSETKFLNPIDKEEQSAIGQFFHHLDDLITLQQRKLEKMKEMKSVYLSEMFPAEGQCKPRLRFEGFTDDWEQRELGKFGKTYTGLSGKSKEDFGHGDAKFITYMNVFQNPVAKKEMVDSIEIDEKQNLVKKGDVLFTTSSETPEEVGMSSVWKFEDDNIYLNSFCFGYRPTESIDLDFLAFMLRSDSVRENIKLLAQGISRYNISKTKMMEIQVPLPSLEEQSAIGRFFRHLDDLITLQQRKLEKLKEMKSTYLAKMFI